MAPSSGLPVVACCAGGGRDRSALIPHARAVRRSRSRRALLAFKDRYNRRWLVERQGHHTPTAAREALRWTVGVAA